MKILIVDDDEFSRVMLFEMLKHLGQCDMAVNGYEAIDAYMRAYSEGESYDLICLDVIMPEIDGIQVLKQIRSIEALNSVYYPDTVRILMVSSISELEHIMMSFDHRSEAYMVKPFENDQLLERLTALGFEV